MYVRHPHPPTNVTTATLLCLVADVEKKETAGASAAVGGSAPERQSSRPPLLRVTSVTDHPEVFDEIGEMEKEFCFSMFDRLMGLLALMLPKEKEVSGRELAKGRRGGRSRAVTVTGWGGSGRTDWSRPPLY